MAVNAEGGTPPPPRTGAGGPAGSMFLPPSGTPTTQPKETTVPKTTPGSRSPRVPVYTAVPNNNVSSPRVVYGPSSEVTDDLAVGRESRYADDAPSINGKAMPDFLADLADFMGRNRSASSLWNTAVDIAKRDGVSVTNAVLRIARDAGYLQGEDGKKDPKGNGPSGSRPRSGSGPSSGSGGSSMSVDTNYADAFNVRAIADAVTMEMLGRGVEQDEMERILARVRKYEARNPSVRQGAGAGGISQSVSSGGTSAAGYEEVIKRIVAKNPEYGDYQKATTMMDWFDQALSERLQANG